MPSGKVQYISSMGTRSTLDAPITEVTSAYYTTSEEELFILCNRTSSGPVTINLIAGAYHVTGTVVVKDKKGDAGTNTVTVNPSGFETIDGASSKTITANQGAFTLVFSGTEWSVV